MSAVGKETLVKYKTLPVWTETTLPQSFQTRHNTKQGTWGKITVAAGRLQFDALDEAGNVLTREIITPENTDFFVSPGAWHRVKPLGTLRCQVEFFCRPEDYYPKKYGFAPPHRDVRSLLQSSLADRQAMTVIGFRLWERSECRVPTRTGASGDRPRSKCGCDRSPQTRDRDGTGS